MSKPEVKNVNKLLFLLAVACTPLFNACTDNAGKGRVMGTVMVNGEPAQSGALTFVPLDRNLQKTGTRILEDGKYDVIVAIGKSKVEIRVPVVIGQERRYDTPDSPMMDVTRESLPFKYNRKTELEIDVASGTNEKDWELTVKSKESSLPAEKLGR